MYAPSNNWSTILQLCIVCSFVITHGNSNDSVVLMQVIVHGCVQCVSARFVHHSACSQETRLCISEDRMTLTSAQYHAFSQAGLESHHGVTEQLC